VPAEAILAVTFTNKAAEEMRNRVSDLLLRAGVPPAQPWLSTFHSLCARLLRREAAAAGLPRDLPFLMTTIRLPAVKLAMTKLQIGRRQPDAEKCSQPDQLREKSWPDLALRAEAFDQNGRRTGRYFRRLRKALHESKALDFDDLLLRSARLLRESTATREKWQARFQYIHVDEYQDTNRVQYELDAAADRAQAKTFVVG